MWRQIRDRSRFGEAQRNSTQKIEKTGRSTNLGTRNSGTRMIKEQKQHELNLTTGTVPGLHEHYYCQECKL